MKNYRIEYPATIMFDVCAANARDAKRVAIDELAPIIDGLNIDLTAPFSRVYPRMTRDGYLKPGWIQFADIHAPTESDSNGE